MLKEQETNIINKYISTQEFYDFGRKIATAYWDERLKSSNYDDTLMLDYKTRPINFSDGIFILHCVGYAIILEYYSKEKEWKNSITWKYRYFFSKDVNISMINIEDVKLGVGYLTSQETNDCASFNKMINDLTLQETNDCASCIKMINDFISSPDFKTFSDINKYFLKYNLNNIHKKLPPYSRCMKSKRHILEQKIIELHDFMKSENHRK